MGTNTLAPTGLVFSRNKITNAPTFQSNIYTIKSGYATKIGLGDIAASGTGGNQGYVILAADNATTYLGVFAGVQPYYDLNLQTTVFTQWWTGTANPSADVGCFVIDDPNAVFRAQVVGGPFVQNWRGQNINWTAGTNGAPNISGISTLSLAGAGVATTNTLQFRITAVDGMSGGPQDPANTNPIVEVTMNFGLSESQQSTGV